ncbi:MAG: hypothetical protein IJI41_04920 [Anaerolineaceae bacterium]|nr:hypothetical protein [Anaerolineaceae bacterium]
MIRNKKRRILIECVTVFIILIFCQWFFFRNVIFTNTGALFGDRGDGRLTTLLAEHWYKFFRGEEKFSELTMFYPIDGVIGYTDLLFMYGMIHSILRTIGLNMFAAYKWTIVLVCTAGTFGMYYLLRKTLKIHALWSLFGTLAFCFSDTLGRHLNHTQLSAVSFLPFLLIFLIDFLRNITIRKKRNIYAYLLLTLFVLLTYNSWYIACFTGIFSLFFLFIYSIIILSQKLPFFSLIHKYIRLLWKDILCYIVFTVISFIPFLNIYIPILRSSSGYSYYDCAQFMPEIVDIINVTETNFMLGDFMKYLKLSSRNYSAEVTMGYSIILLVLFVYTFFKVKKRYIFKVTNSQSLQYKRIMILAVYVAVIFTQFSITRLSANGVSLWMFFYHFLPVAKSIRAIARFMLWLSFPMTVVTSYAADQLLLCKKIRGKLIASLFIILVFVSNINTIGVNQNWNKPYDWNFLSNVPAPPDHLDSFYIIDTGNKCETPVVYQLDAFEIATWYSIKTINGYSGQFPSGWKIWNLCDDFYEENVFNWIEIYNLENVYAFDKTENEWIPVEERKKY